MSLLLSVSVKPTSTPGVSVQRSTSSPNVLDDSWLLGFKPTENNSPPAGAHLEKAKENADSRAFHIVPNRIQPDSGPKRCPVTAELFQEPVASGGAGGGGGGGGGGFGLMQSSQGEYFLVGATSPPSPTKVVANPQFVPQFSQSSQPQKPKHTQPVEGRNSPQPKRQGDHWTPVGAYSLVGIPEVAGQSPVLHTHSPVVTPTAVKSVPSKENTGVPMEVKGYPNIGSPVQVKSNPDTSFPVEVKGNPIVEPSYELVGQRQLPVKGVVPPSVRPYKPRNAGVARLDVEKGAKDEKQKTVAENKTGPNVSLRGQADGAPLEASVVTAGAGACAIPAKPYAGKCK